MDESIIWEPGSSPADSIARLSPALAAVMAPLIEAEDSAGIEAVVQHAFGPISPIRDFTFTNERTGSVAYRSVAGVWSFRKGRANT